MAGRDVYISGAAHTAFGEHWERSFRDLLTEAGLAAIEDAAVGASAIDEVFVGSMSTGKLLNQEHAAPLMMDGAGLAGLHVPATRIEAGAASGAAAFRQGVMAIRSGAADCVVVGGIEKMSDVSDADQAAIASSGIDQEWELFFGADEAALQSIITQAHMAEHGTTREQLAEVAVKNHRHAVNNPLAQFRREITAETVLRSPAVAEPLRMFDLAPMSDGAACIVLTAEAPGARDEGAVRVAGCAQATDTLRIADRDTLTAHAATITAARTAYQQAGISAADVDVAEVHDGATISEIIAIEDLGLVNRGDGGPATAAGRTSYGGDVVVNPGGGLKARGHPAGATGVAQLCELTWQLRGTAGKRQVDGARFGVGHNVGGTGATAVVTVLEGGSE